LKRRPLEFYHLAKKNRLLKQAAALGGDKAGITMTSIHQKPTIDNSKNLCEKVSPAILDAEGCTITDQDPGYPAHLAALLKMSRDARDAGDHATALDMILHFSLHRTDEWRAK
jgi:hypothetical protein